MYTYSSPVRALYCVIFCQYWAYIFVFSDKAIIVKIFYHLDNLFQTTPAIQLWDFLRWQTKGVSFFSWSSFLLCVESCYNARPQISARYGTHAGCHITRPGQSVICESFVNERVHCIRDVLPQLTTPRQETVSCMRPAKRACPVRHRRMMKGALFGWQNILKGPVERSAAANVHNTFCWVCDHHIPCIVQCFLLSFCFSISIVMKTNVEMPLQIITTHIIIKSIKMQILAICTTICNCTCLIQRLIVGIGEIQICKTIKINPCFNTRVYS